MKKSAVYIISLLTVCTCVWADTRHQIFMGDKFQSGFLPVSDKNDKDLFYVYLPYRYDKTDSHTQDSENPKRIILWVTGAAGCSSEFSLFAENGPVFVSSAADGSTQKLYNKNSWTEVADMLYVDQPLGVGFSDLPTDRSLYNYLSNADIIASEMRIFLQNFIKKNPSLINRDIYIAGESHAAQFAPSIAIHLANNPIQLNIKGILLGSPWVDPISQYPAVADFLYERDLISPKMYEMSTHAFETCTNLLREGRNAVGLIECNLALTTLIGILGDINPRNVKTICKDGLKPSCYDTDAITRFLNSDMVKSEMGVDLDWKSCNPITQFAILLNGEWRESTEMKISRMLQKGLRVLIYIGNDDGLCNWRGIDRWISNFSLDLKGYRNLYPRDFIVGGEKAGQIFSQENLYMARMFDAGYLVPRDQPAATLKLVSEFLEDELSGQTGTKKVTDSEAYLGDKNRPYFMAKRKIM